MSLFVIVLYFTIQSNLLCDCKTIELYEGKLYSRDTSKTFELHDTHNINKRDNFLVSEINNKLLFDEDLLADNLNFTNEYITIYYYDEHCIDNGIQFSHTAECSYRIPDFMERNQTLTLDCESIESINCEDYAEEPTEPPVEIYEKYEEKYINPDDTKIKSDNEISDTHLNIIRPPSILENITIYTNVEGNLKNKSDEGKPSLATKITTEVSYKIITTNPTEVTDITISPLVTEMKELSKTESNTTTILLEYDKTTETIKLNTTIENNRINIALDKSEITTKASYKIIATNFTEVTDITTSPNVTQMTELSKTESNTTPILFEFNKTSETMKLNRTIENNKINIASDKAEITTESSYKIITTNFTEMTTSPYLTKMTEFSKTESNTTPILFKYDKTTELIKLNTTIEDNRINKALNKEKQVRKKMIQLLSKPLNNNLISSREDNNVAIITASAIAAASLASSLLYFAVRKMKTLRQSGSYRIPDNNNPCQSNRGFQEINTISSA